MNKVVVIGGAVLMGLLVIQHFVYKHDLNNLRAEQAANAVLIASTQDSLAVIKTDYGNVQVKYAGAVSDLDAAVADNAQLKKRVKTLEKELKIKVTEIDHLEAYVASLETQLQGIVTIHEDGSGFVTVTEDTMGIHLRGKIEWPTGITTLSIKRDPIEFYITMQKTPSGLIAKSIDFPGQPWISVKKWDIIVEGQSKTPTISEFFSNPLGSLKDAEILSGVNFGTHGVGLDVGVQLRDLHIVVGADGKGMTYHVTKSFKLW